MLVHTMTSLLASQLYGDYEEDEVERAPEPRRKMEEPVQARKEGSPAVESAPKTDQYETADSEEASGGEMGFTTRKRKRERVVEISKQKGRKWSNKKPRGPVSKDGSPKHTLLEGPVPTHLLPEDKGGICVEKPTKLGYRKWRVGVFELGFALVPIVKEKK